MLASYRGPVIIGGMAKLIYPVLGLLLFLVLGHPARAEDAPSGKTNAEASTENEPGKPEDKKDSEVVQVLKKQPTTVDDGMASLNEAVAPAVRGVSGGGDTPHSGVPDPEDEGDSRSEPDQVVEQDDEQAEESGAQGLPAVAVESVSEPIDESQFEEMPKPEVLPFAKGDMEAALNLAMAGSGDYFYFGAGGSYAYYIIDRLAPGVEVNYTHVFLNQDFGYDEPNTLTMMPFLKFVVMRSRSVAPYLVATGGYQVEWGSDVATSAWIVGGGGGVHVGLGKHFALNIQLVALYYWYGNTRVYSFKDGGIVRIDGNDYVCSDSGNCDRDFEGEGSFYAAKTEDPNGLVLRDSNTGATSTFVNCSSANGETPIECLQTSNYRCDANGEYCAAPYNDPADKKRELFFPLITFGITYFF